MKEEVIKMDFKKVSIHGEFAVVTFMNDGSNIYFIPSLNISGYGDTPQDAEDMANESLKDFLDALLLFGEEKSLEELYKLGWKKNTSYKQMLSLAFVGKEGFWKELDLPEQTVINQTTIIVR